MITSSVNMSSGNVRDQPGGANEKGAVDPVLEQSSAPASSLSDSDGDQAGRIEGSNGSNAGLDDADRANSVSTGRTKSPTQRVRGRVKWFNYHKGFGFITMENEDGEVFVHQSNIKSEGFRSLREEEEVEFDLVIGEDGKKKAFNVTGPGGQPPQGAVSYLNSKMTRGMGVPGMMMNVPNMSGMSISSPNGPGAFGAQHRNGAGGVDGAGSNGHGGVGVVAGAAGAMSPVSPSGLRAVNVPTAQGYANPAVCTMPQMNELGAHMAVGGANGVQGQESAQAFYGQMPPMFYQQAYYQLNESGYPQAYPMSPTQVHQGRGYGGYNNRGWYAGPRPPPPGTPGYSSGLQVVVHNLPWDCSWQALRAAFEGIGPIERADVVFDSHGRSRGFGVVRFGNRESALLAVEKMNDATISGRVVSVRVDRFA